MKGGKAIAIPLSAGALDVLKAIQGQHPTFCFTFRGQPVKEIKTAFQAACIRADVGRMESIQDPILLSNARGCEKGMQRYVADRSTSTRAAYTGFTWHGLRHTWATWHIQNGTPLEVLQKLGGWSDLRMVMNYAHHSPGYLAGFANNTKEKK